jgi:hypothetical protein
MPVCSMWALTGMGIPCAPPPQVIGRSRLSAHRGVRALSGVHSAVIGCGERAFCPAVMRMSEWMNRAAGVGGAGWAGCVGTRWPER